MIRSKGLSELRNRHFAYLDPHLSSKLRPAELEEGHISTGNQKAVDLYRQDSFIVSTGLGLALKFRREN